MDAPPESAARAVTGTPRSARRGLRGNPRVARVLWSAHDLFVLPLRAFNAGLRGFSAFTHHLQYKVEGFLRPSAEWFDHEVDAQWQWPKRGRATFLERGVLNTLGIPPGARVLELCSGDGFNTGRFYGPRADHVIGIDHDARAVAHARRHHGRRNVEFHQGDVLGTLPAGPFDNVIFDAAIHHFTPEDAARILVSAHGVMRPDGLLSGYTVIEPGDDYEYTRNTFADPESLARLLGAEFAHVAVLETPDPLRRNLYFFASESLARLPFAEGVSAGVSRPLG